MDVATGERGKAARGLRTAVDAHHAVAADVAVRGPQLDTVALDERGRRIERLDAVGGDQLDVAAARLNYADVEGTARATYVADCGDVDVATGGHVKERSRAALYNEVHIPARDNRRIAEHRRSPGTSHFAIHRRERGHGSRGYGDVALQQQVALARQVDVRRRRGADKRDRDRVVGLESMSPVILESGDRGDLGVLGLGLQPTAAGGPLVDGERHVLERGTVFLVAERGIDDARIHGRVRSPPGVRRMRRGFLLEILVGKMQLDAVRSDVPEPLSECRRAAAIVEHARKVRMHGDEGVALLLVRDGVGLIRRVRRRVERPGAGIEHQHFGFQQRRRIEHHPGSPHVAVIGGDPVLEAGVTAEQIESVLLVLCDDAFDESLPFGPQVM